MFCHDVLASRELLSLIFDHLTPPDFDHEEGLPNDWRTREYYNCIHALNAAARACKTLSDPALAVLWRRVNNISDLLRILPGWEDIGGKGYDEALIISGDITPDIWARFRRYTLLVKVVNQLYWEWIHPYTWVLLTPWCRGEPLLPNVETFRVLPICAHSPCTTLFLSPSLRHLWVTLVDGAEPEDAHVGAILIRKIALTVPGLKTFHVKSKMDAGSPILVDIFWHLRDLRSLSLTNTYIRRPELDVLAALPHLESLSVMVMLPPSEQRPDRDDSDGDAEGEDHDEGLDGDEEDVGDEEHENDEDMDDEKSGEETYAAPIISDAFLALRQLTLRGFPGEQDLLFRYRPPRLEAFSLEICGRASFEEVRNIVASNARNLPATLSAFSLKTCEEWVEQEQLSLIELIEALFELPTIETINLEFRDVPTVSDEGIAGIMTRPTQLALMYVATRCPHLRELVLPEVEFARLPLRVPVSNHSLKTLSFDIAQELEGRRPHQQLRQFNDHVEVAMAVDLLFPHLDLRMRDDPTPDFRRDETDIILHHLAPPRRRVSIWYKVRSYIEAAQAGRERGKLLRQPSLFKSRLSTLWAC
ncbi:uncharacterized protein TRAVEDRAFT_51733 [Trametes versicolor FP-101664 SS1]|uniref:uncharacterized protein n=1 Tax=Trametes versicolor (strain FP-101664) TaxID=717944 RepID=UPI0004623921|nr:uncharacterized protein TRAVEDRAFT_51733 [Trametes versicolor FP-101664 SS1]EIW53999.1 hypothetical protein TRAVEDRAFT_51733 [Trametes versicolor FP-101664 SS1]